MNNPSLNVLRPTASTLDTSSYVNVPAIPTLPVTVRSPLTNAFPVTSIPAPNLNCQLHHTCPSEILNLVAKPLVVIKC